MTGAPEEWSAPRIVDPHAREPLVLGEMAEVRRAWARERRARRGRRLWPYVVLALLAVIVACLVLLTHLLRF